MPGKSATKSSHFYSGGGAHRKSRTEKVFPVFPEDSEPLNNPKFDEFSSVNDSSPSKTNYHHFIRCVQKFILYETKSRFFLIGSNHDQSMFRVLRIDRNEPKNLQLYDDGLIYEPQEIQELLKIDVRTKSGGGGQQKTTSAYGLVGFVRFLEGYYMILITSRRRTAMIGHHCVYKIEDTAVIYIPNDDVREIHPDEPRYLKMFQAIDLSSNFYFSYSYDLTHTLQYNMADPKTIFLGDKEVPLEDIFKDSSRPPHLGYHSVPNYKFMWNKYLTDPLKNRLHPDWILNIVHGFVDQANVSIYGTPVLMTLIARRSNKFAGTRFLKRGANFDGDVANEVETEQIVGDSSISNLKKANMSSFVQIRGSVPAHWSQDISKMVPKPPIYIELNDPHCISAARHFNELMKTYGIPIICLNLVRKREKRKRHESILAVEFSRSISYLNMFSSRVNHIQYVHFDMAKCKKSRNSEVISRLEDIAVKSVAKTGIFHNKKPSYWHEIRPPSKYDEMINEYHNKQSNGFVGTRQTGVIRTNCVDCLDRTNTAQFVIGKCALGLQMFALGYIPEPKIEYETDCARMLEAMYEDHGDTLALQYGGSQLIHRIKSYRKNANQWTSKANDITQTLRRYYSNTLSDAEKQMTMNVFLGVFVPDAKLPPIWDKEHYSSDNVLHNPQLLQPIDVNGLDKRVDTQWWDLNMKRVLPRSLYESQKPCRQILQYVSHEEKFDLFYDYYRPFELTVMSDIFVFKEVSHSVRDYMPHCSTNYSPFVIRDRQGKRQEENAALKGKTSFTNIFPSFSLSSSSSFSSFPSSSSTPSASAVVSSKRKQRSDVVSSSKIEDSDEASSTTSSVSSSSDNEGSIRPCSGSALVTDNMSLVAYSTESSFDLKGRMTFSTLFRSTKETYGFNFKDPNAEDMLLYKRFSMLDDRCRDSRNRMVNIISKAGGLDKSRNFPFIERKFKVHDYAEALFPKIPEEDVELYRRHVEAGKIGVPLVKDENTKVYEAYLNNKT